MSIFKKAKVVMLPTNEKAIPVGTIFINQPQGKWNDNKLHIEKCERITQHGHSWSGFGIKTDIQHLYITSDDEIKEGDWWHNVRPNSMYIDIKAPIASGRFAMNSNAVFINPMKIIATTDSSLLSKCKCLRNQNVCTSTIGCKPLPQPSQSFMEVFVREYNKGNVITDVLVEYETDYLEWKNSSKESLEDTLKPKINPKDKTITIKKVEEVINLLYKHTEDMFKEEKITLNKWIEENL